jgi:hypothetical protein
LCAPEGYFGTFVRPFTENGLTNVPFELNFLIVNGDHLGRRKGLDFSEEFFAGLLTGDSQFFEEGGAVIKAFGAEGVFGCQDGTRGFDVIDERLFCVDDTGAGFDRAHLRCAVDMDISTYVSIDGEFEGIVVGETVGCGFVFVDESQDDFQVISSGGPFIFCL